MLLDGDFGVECLKIGSLEDGVENVLLVDHDNCGLQSGSRSTGEDFTSPDLVESRFQDGNDRLLDDRADVGRTNLRQTTSSPKFGL